MSKNIYIVGGSKGGVGKSFVTISLVDYLQKRGEEVLLVETDNANPDVWKIYNGTTSAVTANLDEREGWIELVNACQANPKAVVVINTAARNNVGVSAYGDTLNLSLEELQRKLVTLWVINRQRDSLELLKKYMEAIPTSDLHVVRNAYFGEERKFALYNGSDLRKRVEDRGGKSVNFPELADLVSDEIYSKRMSIERASKDLPLGQRAELTRWRNDVAKMFEALA